MDEFECIPAFIDHPLPAMTIRRREHNWNFFIFVINGNQTFISQRDLRFIESSVRCEQSSIFSSRLGFEGKSEFDHKTLKLKPHWI